MMMTLRSTGASIGTCRFVTWMHIRAAEISVQMWEKIKTLMTNCIDGRCLWWQWMRCIWTFLTWLKIFIGTTLTSGHRTPALLRTTASHHSWAPLRTWGEHKSPTHPLIHYMASNDPWLFQHDIVPVHKASSLKTWFAKVGVVDLEWLAQTSTSLNLFQDELEPQTSSPNISAWPLVAEWTQIPTATPQNPVESLHRKLERWPNSEYHTTPYHMGVMVRSLRMFGHIV